MKPHQYVKTNKERCRVCYTCVRECPAKAIRIAEGQAEVLPERCICCGNCVRVCSQKAKQIFDSRPHVKEMLDGKEAVAAMLAPSFPSEFPKISHRTVVGMLRRMGFSLVTEVAFGADLVAAAYRNLLDGNGSSRHIATTCPAIVAFVERYYPDLVPALAPIVSPMIAMAKALHEIHGQSLKTVFIGPCVAKKAEAAIAQFQGQVDAVLTFSELQEMFQEASIAPQNSAESDFDPPRGGLGALFPVSRGLLQTADIQEDLLTDQVIAADGRANFVQAIDEFGIGQLRIRLLEVLACNGCIMGPSSTSKEPLLARRTTISQYVRTKMESFNRQQWLRDMERLATLNLSRDFTACDQRMPVPFEDEIRQIMVNMGKVTPLDELNCGACGYETCLEHAAAIFKGLAESEMCLPNTIEKLHVTVHDLADSNSRLASAQEALMQSEKLASMGQLAAGIAHEINNPLGVVLMYSHLLQEEYAANSALHEDLSLITEQANRCKKIVEGLLSFSRQSGPLTQPTDLCDLIGRTIKTMPAPEAVKVVTEFEVEELVAEVDPDQIAQVLTNLISNAYVAMPNGGTLTFAASGDEESVSLMVRDTGIGISQRNIKKIFDPFFTTKQIGKGTGLGLAVTYGIVSMHAGKISVESNDDPGKGPTGTTMTITLPRTSRRPRR
jgi:iron only hydrogenase large subunit-like protein/nitrogen-specific signal transduction histidine kinase